MWSQLSSHIGLSPILSTSILDYVTTLHQAGPSSVTQFCTHSWWISWIEKKNVRSHQPCSFFLLCNAVPWWGKIDSSSTELPAKPWWHVIFDPQVIDWDWVSEEDTSVILKIWGGREHSIYGVFMSNWSCHYWALTQCPALYTPQTILSSPPPYQAGVTPITTLSWHNWST